MSRACRKEGTGVLIRSSGGRKFITEEKFGGFKGVNLSHKEIPKRPGGKGSKNI